MGGKDIADSSLTGFYLHLSPTVFQFCFLSFNYLCCNYALICPFTSVHSSFSCNCDWTPNKHAFIKKINWHAQHGCKPLSFEGMELPLWF